jgi:DNA-binding MarR family transcriptional regulator
MFGLLGDTGRTNIARIVYGIGINPDQRMIGDMSEMVRKGAMIARAMNLDHNASSAGTMVLIPRLAKQIMRRVDPELLGIDLRLLIALSYLGDHDGAPQQELVDALCIDAKNVVLLLNELEDCGHLVRRRDPEDRRRHRVYITDDGRQVLARAARVQADVEDEVLQALDEDERATLLDLLARALAGAELTAHRVPHPGLRVPHPGLTTGVR